MIYIKLSLNREKSLFTHILNSSSVVGDTNKKVSSDYHHLIKWPIESEQNTLGYLFGIEFEEYLIKSVARGERHCF